MIGSIIQEYFFLYKRQLKLKLTPIMLKILQFQLIPFYFCITPSLLNNSNFSNKTNNLLKYVYTISYLLWAQQLLSFFSLGLVIMSQLKKKIAKILMKRIKIIGSVKLSTVLEELEIQIHGPCFKLPILIMERSL